MRRVVNFSGGLGSFWAAHRVIEKHGRDSVTLLFADVLIEHESLYRFNRKAEEVLGVPITRISEEVSPWELFRRQGCIGNSAHPICSHLLKREPLDRWMRANTLELNTVLYVGFDWTELHRLQKLRVAKPTWLVEAPMTEKPLWDKCKMKVEAEKLGLPVQPAYEFGFPHNNCGMRCVAAGFAHWVRLLEVAPERFLEWENEEIETLKQFSERGIDPYTILKDRRGGQTKNLLLRDLRLRVEAGEKFRSMDWGGCGCGGAI